MTQIPTADPFGPTPVFPTAEPEPTGILNADGILPGSQYYNSNRWRGYDGGYEIDIISVVDKSADNQQALLELTSMIIDPTNANLPHVDPQWYKTPARVGVVMITQADGLLLTVTAMDDPSVQFKFNVHDRTWAGPFSPTPTTPGAIVAAQP